MSLLNRNFKSDTSSRLCGVVEECSQYFQTACGFELNINGNSLILNPNKLFDYVYIDLGDLNYICNRFSFLIHLYVNSDLCISNESANKFTGTPFHIQTDKSIDIMNYGPYNYDLDVSNISFKCAKFGIECVDENIKNIKLTTREISIPIENNINQICYIDGEIKTDTITFCFGLSAYEPDLLKILDSISIISEPLSELFTPMFQPGYNIKRDKLALFEHINPIKLLGIEHYNAINYNFILNYNMLTFTKDNSIKGGIKMADGWYVVFDKMR